MSPFSPPLSRFCLGYVSSEDTVLRAYDQGINFFFLTGDYHWPYYERLRRGLERLFERGPEVREKVCVAVVSYVTQPEFCRAAYPEVLACIKGLEYIDMMILGGSYSSDFMIRLSILQQCLREHYLGVRAIGATFHDRAAARIALQGHLLDIAFVRYNPLHPAIEEDVLPFISPRQMQERPLLYTFKSTFGYVAPDHIANLNLDGQYWRPTLGDMYRFALSPPEVDGILCAPQTPAEVDAMLDAVAKGPLTDEERTYLKDLAALDAGLATLDTPSAPHGD